MAGAASFFHQFSFPRRPSRYKSSMRYVSSTLELRSGKFNGQSIPVHKATLLTLLRTLRLTVQYRVNKTRNILASDAGSSAIPCLHLSPRLLLISAIITDNSSCIIASVRVGERWVSYLPENRSEASERAVIYLEALYLLHDQDDTVSRENLSFVSFACF